MPARTGAEYIAGLRERSADVYIGGERVKDVTAHPAFAGGLQTVASLLEMQHDPARRDEMTYTSPTTGDPVGLSFIMPRNLEDLQRRRKMITNWAKGSCGMMGRTPDFLNVAVMSMAAGADYCAQNRPDFGQKHPELLRVHPRKRHRDDPYAGQPATKPRSGPDAFRRPHRRCAVGGGRE